MPYIKEICKAGRTIEIRVYYSARNHPKGEKRAEKTKETTEGQKKVNEKKAERELRRLLNENFEDGDYLVRLDFCKMHFPKGSEQMQEYMRNFLKKMRTEFAKTEEKMKYVYVKEVGPRGGRHVHMVMNKCDTDVLRKCWTYGGIHIDPLNSNGQYRRIASYFIKYASRTEETEGRMVGKRWNPSRGLRRPKVVKKTILRNRFPKNPKERKGYYLDKDSVVSGISDYTGYEYFTYTLIKGIPPDRDG